MANTATKNTPKPTARKRTTKANADDTITLVSVRQAFAAAHDVSIGDAGKTLRRKLRTTPTWKALTEADPAQYGADGTIKVDANDGRPWGTLPRTFVRDVLGVEV